MNNDLWPDDFGTDPERNAVTVLKEQAALLGPKTKHLVEAEVQTIANPRTSSGTDFIPLFHTADFIHRFVIKAPALDYSYALFRVLTHIKAPYPVDVLLNTGEERSASNEKELTELIREILTAEETRQIIRTLILQSQS